jgi:DNA-binding protein
MSYLLAVITCFNTANTKEVTLKARGQAITIAVDVAEITRCRFMENMKVNNIQLGTEEMPVEEGGTRAVSTIEITLAR